MHPPILTAGVRGRSAFSMIEVMVAVAVVAIGLMALLEGIATQKVARDGVRDSQRVAALLTALNERLISQEWRTLGVDGPNDPAGTGWSTPTPFDIANPLAGGKPEALLLRHGLLVQPTGLQNLRVYVEYYRAETQFGGARGLLDNDTGGFVSNRPRQFANELEARTGLPTRLVQAQRFDTNPTAVIGSGEPLAIRVVVAWRADAAGSQVFGGREIPIPGGGRARIVEQIIARGDN